MLKKISYGFHIVLAILAILIFFSPIIGIVVLGVMSDQEIKASGTPVSVGETVTINGDQLTIGNNDGYYEFYKNGAPVGRQYYDSVLGVVDRQLYIYKLKNNHP